MSSDNKGIALLLQAEKEAGKIIQDARDARKARIQQAKLEAKRDIDAYLADRNAAFNAFKNEHQRGTSEIEEGIKKDTANQIAGIDNSVDKNMNAVVDMLLKYVVNVEIKGQ